MKIEKHDMDVAAIVVAIQNEDVVDDGDGGECRMLYLGSILNLTPSGKMYAPFACSNLDLCPACKGEGKVKNKRHKGNEILFEKAEERVALFRNMITSAGFDVLSVEGKANYDFSRCVADRLKPLVVCPRCDGVGSAEARDDEVWRETLEEDLSAHGIYLTSGEGDGCDLFAVLPVEEEGSVEDEEVAL